MQYVRGEIRVAENDVPLQRKDGSVFLASIGGSPVVLGDKAYVVGIFRDVDAQRRTEKQLKDSERRFRDLLESAPDGILMVDADGIIRLANRRVDQLFGHAREELVGKPVEVLVPERAVAMHADHRRRYYQEPEHRQMGTGKDLFARRKDGREFPVEISLSPMTTDEGVVTLAAIRDVSDRKETEARLAESEHRFRQLAENISEVFFLWDLQIKRMLYVSPAYSMVWGEAPDALYRRPWAFLHRIHPEDRAALQDMVRAQTTAAVPREEGRECRLVQPDGALRWIWYRVFPIRDVAGAVVRYGGVATDITYQKAAERERLNYASAQRDNLVREVHHRIKNHLQGVMGLLDGYAGRDSRLAPILNEAIAQVHTVALVHGLLGRAVCEAVLFPPMVETIMDNIRRVAATEVGLALASRTQCSAREGMCRCGLASDHAVPVALIINELFTNAVKYAAGSPYEITAALDCDAESAWLTITNPGALPAGFDFTGGNGLGTGLGLIRSLLPRQGAALEMTQEDGHVRARLSLCPPVLQVVAVAGSEDAGERRPLPAS